MVRIAAFAFGVGVLFGLSASAATVDVVKGQVLINHGKGFQRVASNTEARAGDLIIASPGGSAKIVYPGGCTTEVKPGTVITVTDGSKCAGAMRLGHDDDCKEPADPKELSKEERCGGYLWWPIAVGVAIPIAGFLISTNNDPGNGNQNQNQNQNQNNNGGGGGGGTPGG